jgi:hypothetical protein
MTYGIRHHEENNVSVSFYWEKDNYGGYYVVSAGDLRDGLSYTFMKRTYALNDKKNAEATFRRYVKKYCKGE